MLYNKFNETKESEYFFNYLVEINNYLMNDLDIPKYDEEKYKKTNIMVEYNEKEFYKYFNNFLDSILNKNLKNLKLKNNDKEYIDTYINSVYNLEEEGLSTDLIFSKYSNRTLKNNYIDNKYLESLKLDVDSFVNQFSFGLCKMSLIYNEDKEKFLSSFNVSLHTLHDLYDNTISASLQKHTFEEVNKFIDYHLSRIAHKLGDRKLSVYFIDDESSNIYNTSLKEKVTLINQIGFDNYFNNNTKNKGFKI